MLKRPAPQLLVLGPGHCSGNKEPDPKPELRGARAWYRNCAKDYLSPPSLPAIVDAPVGVGSGIHQSVM